MRKLTQLKWSIELAAAEFDINPRTLSKAVKRLAIEPTFDGGKFSTRQIAAAVFGDIDGERLRKLKHEADLLEVALAKERSQLLDTEIVLKVWTDVAISVRQIIKASNLSDTEKNEILKNIRTLNENDFVDRHSADKADTSEDA